MGFALQVHMVAAALALAFGTVALAVAKGGDLHRKSGRLFVYTMLAMALTGAGLAAVSGNLGNVIAGTLTAYLVVTALLTVLPSTTLIRRVEFGGMFIALIVAAGCIVLGVEALTSPRGVRFGIPFPVYFMFGTVAVLATAGDVRMIRSGPLRGAPRLTRHLWRMCYAFWIATASFFLGPRARIAKLIPEPLITTPVLGLPVLAVVVILLYWLWRVRFRQSLRGIVTVKRGELVG